jgi:hypothetical protein
MTAARSGSAAALTVLLAAGAEVDARERWHQQTALMWAAAANHAPAVRLLVEHGADVNARARVLEGEPKREIVDFRTAKDGLALQALLTSFPRGGLTPLLLAAREGALSAAGALVDAGADVNLPDPDEIGPLTVAILNGHFELAALLIERGADVRAAEPTGRTPLWAAIDMHTVEWVPNRPPPVVTGPVVSPFGVHLIEVTDRRAEGMTSFEEARESIRNRLASDSLEDRATERARELLAELEDVSEGGLRARMEALAEADDVVRFETSAPFGANAMVPGLGRSPELDAMLAEMGEGDLGDGVATTPRGPAIVRLAELQEPRVPELSEVEDQVRREVEADLRQERAAARLEEIRQGIGATDVAAGLSAAAAELEVELVDAPEFGASGTVQGLGFAPAVNEAALAAEQGELVGPVETPQGPVLFEVTERRGFDAEELASQSEEIRARLAQERFDRLISSLILERKRQEGGIRPSRQLQEQLGGGAAGPA